MKKLLIRTLTGALFVALVVFSVLFSQTVLFNVFLVFTCLGLYEYRSMLLPNGVRLPVLFYVIGLAVYFLLSVEVLQFPFQRVLLLSFCLLLLFMVAALFQKDFAEAVQTLGYEFVDVVGPDDAYIRCLASKKEWRYKLNGHRLNHVEVLQKRKPMERNAQTVTPVEMPPWETHAPTDLR